MGHPAFQDYFNSSIVSLTFQEMKTNKSNIFAAGDVVQFPLDMFGASKVNIGHWQMAHAHGT